MIWFSNRNGLKSYATSGRSQQDVYTMFFTQEGWDEYQLNKEEYELMQAIEEEIGDEEAGDEEVPAKKKKGKKKKEMRPKQRPKRTSLCNLIGKA